MAIWTGVLGTLYSAWLLYAAGPKFLLMSTIVFAIGLQVFWYARKERSPDEPAFTRIELIVAMALAFAAIVATILFATGAVSIT